MGVSPRSVAWLLVASLAAVAAFVHADGHCSCACAVEADVHAVGARDSIDPRPAAVAHADEPAEHGGDGPSDCPSHGCPDDCPGCAHGSGATAALMPPSTAWPLVPMPTSVRGPSPTCLEAPGRGVARDVFRPPRG